MRISANNKVVSPSLLPFVLPLIRNQRTTPTFVSASSTIKLSTLVMTALICICQQLHKFSVYTFIYSFNTVVLLYLHIHLLFYKNKYDLKYQCVLNFNENFLLLQNRGKWGLFLFIKLHQNHIIRTTLKKKPII